MSHAVREVAIIGGGVVGYTAALALSRALDPEVYGIIVVPTATDDQDLGFASATEPTLPDVRLFHAEFGVEEAELVREGIATFSLGTAHHGWTGDGQTTFAPFGDIGAPLGGVAFHQLVARMKRTGAQVRSTDYSIAALMAQAGRFAQPSDDRRSPLSSLSYGLHLDRRRYQDKLRYLAERSGTRQAAAPFAGCNASGDRISSVRLTDGSEISAHFFIDASGPAAVLVGTLPGQSFHSWRQWFPVDRFFSWEEQHSAPPACYNLIATHEAGWLQSVPGPNGVAQLFAFATDHLDETEAPTSLGCPASARPVIVTSGRQARSWIGNVVAIGGAAGLVEPTTPVALHLVQQQVRRILRLFPVGSAMVLEALEYHRETAAELDRTRDFSLLRQALNGRKDTLFWRGAQEVRLLPELSQKIALFRSRGRIPLFDGDLFGEPEWAACFEALGIMPERHEALAEAIPLDQLQAFLERMREAILRAIMPLPHYSDYLAASRKRAAA